MALEEPILRFYLRVFSFLVIFIIYIFYIVFIKEINLKNEYFLIKKQVNYKNIIDTNIIDNKLNLFIYKITLKTFLLIDNKIHFGKFKLESKNTYNKILSTISQPSNIYEKITIVEGWNKKDLNKIFNKNFKEYVELDYDKIIADTYMFSEGSSFNEFNAFS